MPDKNSKNTNRLDKIYIEVNAVINNHHSSKISSYISRLLDIGRRSLGQHRCLDY